MEIQIGPNCELVLVVLLNCVFSTHLPEVKLKSARIMTPVLFFLFFFLTWHQVLQDTHITFYKILPHYHPANEQIKMLS